MLVAIVAVGSCGRQVEGEALVQGYHVMRIRLATIGYGLN